MTDNSLFTLLAQTLTRYVAADAQITEVASTELASGMSGAPVQRHTVAYRSGGQGATTTLITKAAERAEWQTLRHLNGQHQPNVPFAHAIAQENDTTLLICMQDVGDLSRPTSLEPITERELAREAEGLAIIHSTNFAQADALDWLPIFDRSYVQATLFEHFWQPAWQRALSHANFVETFRDAIPQVEAAAATIVDDLALLLNDADSHTLIHADINPSNVLVQEGLPYFIDWATARWGSFYFDLPHHHCTLAQAEHYRQALAARGCTITPADFAARYRVAARYIGLRYIWWTLDYLLSDPSQTAWVQHYIGLITGDGIGTEA